MGKQNPITNEINGKSIVQIYVGIGRGIGTMRIIWGKNQ